MSSSSTSQPTVEEVQEVQNVGKNPITDQGVKIVLLDTPEQLVEHAKKILQDAKNPEWKDVPIDKKLEAFQDKYKEFGRTFPIVLRHIIQSQKLYPEILQRYILLCKHHPTHSVSEFQERQADYLVMIYRKEHPRCSQREISMVKRKHVEDLKREEEYMKKVMDEVKKERDEKSKQFDKDRRGELMGLISRCINDIPEDVELEPLSEVPVKAPEIPETTINQNSSNDDDGEESLVLLPSKKERS